MVSGFCKVLGFGQEVVLDSKHENRLARLRKVKSLAEHGADGERESALALYEKLKRLYDISDSDVVESVLLDCDFRYRTVFEKRLLMQVIYSVVGNAEIWEDARHKSILVHCTAAEEMDIRLSYSVYKPALEKSLNDAFLAFVMVNDVYPGEDVRCPPTDVPDMSLISLERRKELLRASLMADTMEKTELPRALLDKKVRCDADDSE